MIKPNSVLRRKWFQITASVTGAVLVTGGAVGGGVAAAIIDVATTRTAKLVETLGIKPDESTTSDIDLNRFASATAKINVVALGDSVTAGYTTLSYDNVKSGSDTSSYADYIAKNLATANKLGTYDNLAVSGQTSSGFIDTITDDKNTDKINKANLFILTIGANDILNALKLLGVPYSQIASIIGNPLGTSADSVEEQTRASHAALKNDTTTKTVIPNASYLPALFSTLQEVMNKHPEKIFQADAKMLDTQLTNAASNVLKGVSYLHQHAPGAKIIINEYQFPFNRLVKPAVGTSPAINITEIPQESLNEITFGGDKINKDTLRGVYDYVMSQLKDKTTSNFKVVTWNSLQQNQDELINTLVTNKVFPSADVAIADFQKDITDIHPTEYSHALIGQLMFNRYLVPRLGITQVASDYEDLRVKIEGATTPADSSLMEFFLKMAISNSAVVTENNEPTFISRLISAMISEMNAAVGVASVTSIDFTSPATQLLLAPTTTFKLLTSIGSVIAAPRMLAAARTEARNATIAVATATFDNDTAAKTAAEAALQAANTKITTATAAVTTSSLAMLGSVDAFIEKFMFGADATLRNEFKKFVTELASSDISRATGAGSFSTLLGTIVAEASVAHLTPVAASLPFQAALTPFITAALPLSAADKTTLTGKMNIDAATFNLSATNTPGAIGVKVTNWLFNNSPIMTEADISSSPTAVQASLRTLVNAFKQGIVLNKPFNDLAKVIVSLSDTDRTIVIYSITPFGQTPPPASVLADETNATLAVYKYFLNNGLPADESVYDALTLPTFKTAVQALDRVLRAAVSYANDLAAAYPAAFFSLYNTKRKVRQLLVQDLLAPRIAGQTPLITIS